MILQERFLRLHMYKSLKLSLALVQQSVYFSALSSLEDRCLAVSFFCLHCYLSPAFPASFGQSESYVLSFHSLFFSEMFSESFITLIILAWTSSVNAQAVIAPALGIKGIPTIDDVQKPSSSSPCGNIDIAKTFDISTVATASAQGEFSVNVTSFK